MREERSSELGVPKGSNVPRYYLNVTERSVRHRRSRKREHEKPKGFGIPSFINRSLIRALATSAMPVDRFNQDQHAIEADDCVAACNSHLASQSDTFASIRRNGDSGIPYPILGSIRPHDLVHP